jgi:ribonuclease P protein component
MLPRERRLRPRSQVRLTIRRGRRVRRGAVVLHHLADGRPARAAVIAGRGVGPAVTRHRRQRQLRHALAALWDDVPEGALVVRALPGEDDYAQIALDLREAVGHL